MILSDKKPGCYNQPRPTDKSGYWLHTRHYFPDGTYRLKQEWVPFRNAKECKNDFRHPSPSCDGCEHDPRSEKDKAEAAAKRLWDESGHDFEKAVYLTFKRGTYRSST